MTKEDRDLLICYLKCLACINAPSTLDEALAKMICSLHAGPAAIIPNSPLQWQELAIRLASFHIARYLPYLVLLINIDGNKTLSN